MSLWDRVHSSEQRVVDVPNHRAGAVSKDVSVALCCCVCCCSIAWELLRNRVSWQVIRQFRKVFRATEIALPWEPSGWGRAKPSRRFPMIAPGPRCVSYWDISASKSNSPRTNVRCGSSSSRIEVCRPLSKDVALWHSPPCRYCNRCSNANALAGFSSAGIKTAFPPANPEKYPRSSVTPPLLVQISMETSPATTESSELQGKEVSR